jgi:ribonucleoside-diphosphate reductase alpha chain
MSERLEEKLDQSPRYSFDEAINSAREYFKGDELAAVTWVSKYALKDSAGNIYEVSPDQMHQRIAREIARIERTYGGVNPLSEEGVYKLLKDFKYIVPQGSPMAGIGNNLQTVSLSNCFVIGTPSDSYGAIVKTDEEQVQLMKRRGGVGHDLSHLRPKGSPVGNSALSSTGVVPFMERYSNSTREVAQDGRRGALMLTISVKHPDVEDFIDAKLEKGKVTGANVSVKIDDEFMRAVLEDRSYVQQFPINSDEPVYRKEINARELWNKIINNAWKSAEPGVLFWDTIIRESVADSYSDLGFETIATNPCGEIPLPRDDSCRLILQNLYSYVESPFTSEAKFNWDLFKENTHHMQRIMDDIIDLEIEKIDSILAKIDADPEPEEVKLTEKRLWERIRNKAVLGRRMGVGVTGEGDMIAGLGLRYGSDEATRFSTQVHKTMALEVYRSSVELAKERGKFPIYDAEREQDNPFINRLREEDPKLYEEMKKHGRRNIANLTLAPAGSVSIETQTTSGVEPLFEVYYGRRRKVNPNDQSVNIDYVDKQGDAWEKYAVLHHKFEEWMRVSGYEESFIQNIKNLVTEIVKQDKNPAKSRELRSALEEVVSKSPYSGATANEIDWTNRVKLQGEIQKWIDHSISSTVNLPQGVSEDTVREVYQTGWEVGCKGITVYVDQSREGVLLTSKNKSLEDRVELIQKKVKSHPVIDRKAQAVKYRVKRPGSGDSLHLILTSDLYVDDENKRAYFIPDEDFQIRAPLGAATSVSFAQSGMDRTEILRGPSPDWAELVSRLQSAYSNEEEGLGPRRIRSIEHAAGLVFEDFFIRNGIVERDKTTGKLINSVDKSKLRKIETGSEEYKEIISQFNLGTEESDEVEISGNNGKSDGKFECNFCGGDTYTIEAGCHSPKCLSCGQFKGGGCN